MDWLSCLATELLSSLWVSWVVFHTLATSGTVAHQTPLSTGFSRQEHWRGFPFLSPGLSSRPRDRSRVSCPGRLILYCWATRQAQVGVKEKEFICSNGAIVQESFLLWLLGWREYGFRLPTAGTVCPQLEPVLCTYLGSGVQTEHLWPLATVGKGTWEWVLSPSLISVRNHTEWRNKKSPSR